MFIAKNECATYSYSTFFVKHFAALYHLIQTHFSFPGRAVFPSISLLPYFFCALFYKTVFLPQTTLLFQRLLECKHSWNKPNYGEALIHSYWLLLRNRIESAFPDSKGGATIKKLAKLRSKNEEVRQEFFQKCLGEFMVEQSSRYVASDGVVILKKLAASGKEAPVTR